jgi:uncharacterized membrane protein YccC
MTKPALGYWPARLLARFANEVRVFLTPGTRMVDELECVVSVLFAIGLGHLVGAQNISWAAFSGYMVMRGHVAESLSRGIRRIIGTAVGTGLALALVPWVEAAPVLAALALMAVGGVTLYRSLAGRHAYAWLFVGLTFVMILLDKMQRPEDMLSTFAKTRMLEVLAGTGACVLVSMISTLTLRRRWPAPSRRVVEQLGWHPGAARHAGQAAVALLFLPFLIRLWHGPDYVQSAVTIMAVMLVPIMSIGDSGLIPVSRRIVLRVAGCTAGAALAAVFLLLAHSLPSAGVMAPVLIAGMVLGVAIGRHIENSLTSIAYGGTQFVLVILVTLVPDSYAAAHLAPALERLGGIAIGIVLLEPVLVIWHIVAPARRVRDPKGEDPMEPGGV